MQAVVLVAAVALAPSLHPPTAAAAAPRGRAAVTSAAVAVADAPGELRSGAADWRRLLAAPISPDTCAGSATGFCGQRVTIRWAGDQIPDMALGAHWGPGWGMPTSPNNSGGIGFCVDDTHVGVPVGPVHELAHGYNAAQVAVASWILTSYAGDRVSPYQPLAVAADGELAGYSQRERMMAAHLAMRAWLPDPGGAGQVDLGSVTIFQRGTTTPLGNSAHIVALARAMFDAGNDHAPTGGGVRVTVRWEDGRAPVGPVNAKALIVHVESADGNPRPDYPVGIRHIAEGGWAGIEHFAYAGQTSSQSYQNAALMGFPTLDGAGTISGGGVTDAGGDARFVVDVTASPYSLPVAAEVSPAEVHLYGDGINSQGNVQITTSEVRRADAVLAGEFGGAYVRIHKTSTDSAFAVDGIEFQLVDGNGAGDVVASGSVQGGVVDFGPLDLGGLAPPLVVRERAPGNGLAPSADVPVPWPISVDPDDPTVVEIVNRPLVEHLVIVKRLSDDDVSPPDLRGFSFTVRRSADGADAGHWVTGADGRTPPIPVTAGRYEVCEDGAPGWWPSALPAACHEAVVPIDAGTTVELVWTNVVGQPSCATRVRDDADGDQLLSATGGPVTDTVSCSGLITGTEYRVDGELQRRAADGSVTATGLTGATTFTATAAVMEVDVHFDVPDGYACATLVAFETLRIDERIVHVHADPDDGAQTLHVPSLSTRARAASGGKVVGAGEGIVDEVDHCGHPAGEYTMTLVWQTATTGPGSDGQPVTGASGEPSMVCTASTTMTASATFTVAVDGEPGTVTMPEVVVPEGGPGTFVAYETSSQGDTKIASHEDCNSVGQTVWRPDLTTQRAEADPVGPGTNSDVIRVVDVPPPSVLGDRLLTIVGGLHRHAVASSSAGWRCTDDNRVATISIAVDRGDGEYRSPGEPHAPGHTYSYAESLTIVPGSSGPPVTGVDAVTGTADGRWTSAQHGCRVTAQTFTSRAAASTARSGSIPFTGVDITAAVATGLVVLGAGGVMTVAVRRRRRLTR